jgi:hypothetical protein
MNRATREAVLIKYFANLGAQPMRTAMCVLWSVAPMQYGDELRADRYRSHGGIAGDRNKKIVNQYSIPYAKRR